MAFRSRQKPRNPVVILGSRDRWWVTSSVLTSKYTVVVIALAI